MRAEEPPSPVRQQDVVRYFEVAGPDYAAWSPHYNMHFGYWERGLNPFAREPMLERMNLAVLERLDVAREAPAQLADMGCGLGATARRIARERPRARVTGFTIVPWQVASGNRLSREQGLEPRVALVLADYTSTGAESGCMDGAYAIESSCYASGPDKADLLAEMARLVRPGGRIVISDGFRKDARPLGALLGRIYRISCRSWAVREMAVLGEFTARLEALGFVDVRAEERSWRVAPSFVHIPWLCAKFTLQRWLALDFRWPRERWQNLMGPLFGALLGLRQRRFGYYLVSATKGPPPSPARGPGAR